MLVKDQEWKCTTKDHDFRYWQFQHWKNYAQSLEKEVEKLKQNLLRLTPKKKKQKTILLREERPNIQIRPPNIRVRPYEKGRKPKASRYELAKKQATKREKTFLLSEEEYTTLIAQMCHYCNGKIGEKGIGLDRLDNSQGYILTNIVPCCGRCNQIKGPKLNQEQMVKVAVVLGLRAP